MSQGNGLIKTMREVAKQASGAKSDIVYGTVIQLDPLLVQVGDKLVLDEHFLVVEPSVMATLEVGKRVRFLTVADGQKYYTLADTPAPDYERIQEMIDTAVAAAVAQLNASILARRMADHPVGSYYITRTNVNPANILGFGTWVNASVGRYLVGANTSDTDFNSGGKQGGAKTFTIAKTNLPPINTPNNLAVLGSTWGAHGANSWNHDYVASYNIERVS